MLHFTKEKKNRLNLNPDKLKQKRRKKKRP